MLLAEMIESRTASGAQEAIRRLLERAPTKASRIFGDGRKRKFRLMICRWETVFECDPAIMCQQTVIS